MLPVMTALLLYVSKDSVSPTVKMALLFTDKFRKTSIDPLLPWSKFRLAFTTRSQATMGVGEV